MELVRHRPAPASVKGSVLESKWPQHGTCQPQERASSQWLHTISGNFTEEIERLEMSVCHTGVHIPFQVRVFSGYMSRRRIAESYSSSVFSLKILHTVLRSGCTNVHSHQQWRRFPLLYTFFSIYHL